MKEVVFVGDVHLDRDDPAIADFLAFLESLEGRASTLVFLGDLFNLWLGRRELEADHHRAVAERLRALRATGTTVRYVEGNRDYRIGDLYAGDALDDATDRDVTLTFGGVRFHAAHGDLVNPRDRQYRAWRRFSRSPAVWTLFNAIPARSRVRLAERLESRMRGTNLAYKAAFPEEDVRAWAAGRFRSGADVVVLGHFHVEMDLDARPPSPPGRIVVLPEWKGSRRHLAAREDGAVAFVDSVRSRTPPSTGS